MRISRFSANHVYGYLDFDFQFSWNPTILIGPNGSGKTTALRLMQALITPSLRDLLLIEFNAAEIVIEDQFGLNVISARKTRQALHLSVSRVKDSLEVPLNILQNLEPDIADARRIVESSRLLRVKYSDNVVFKHITEITAPVFLGLDRRHGGFQDDGDGEEAFFRTHIHGYTPGRAIKGSLGVGLMETQLLVRDAFRRVRKLKDQQSERLRKRLLLAGFNYAEVSGTMSMDQLREDALLFSNDVHQQRHDLMRALESVGVEEGDARRELDKFFERAFELSVRLNRVEAIDPTPRTAELFFEALINRANLLRLRELVDIVREFNSKSDQFVSRFSNFVACVNRFFADSRKFVEIDPVGQIKIQRPHGVDVPIDALSSGERQILIMFGHIFFNSFGDRSNVFVIDEPEISLHLRWQEMLLGEMIGSSSRAQFIIATHSPEIVGEFSGHCLQV